MYKAHFIGTPCPSIYCNDRFLDLGRLGPMVFDDCLASSEPGENLDRGDIDDGVGMG